ncbi:MAG: hypothetical protein ACXACY_31240 [Candidatus Hodarchaeales archaeon]
MKFRKFMGSHWKKTHLKCKRCNNDIFQEILDSGKPTNNFDCRRMGCTWPDYRMGCTWPDYHGDELTRKSNATR